MFYQCPKCKRTWQHPVGRCSYCFLELEKQKSQKCKVVGVSRVSIPTMLHPQVPYFVLLLKDEKDHYWTQKSIKGYKIGDEFLTEASQEKEAVAVWRVKYDIVEALEKIASLIAKLKINKNSKVLLLPTLISPQHPYFAENSSPQFLEAVIEYLISLGIEKTNIKVAAQSFDEIAVEASAQKSGLMKVCLKNKIAPLDLAKTNFIKKEKDGIVFEISEEAFNNDLIINLPILKLKADNISGAVTNTLKLIKKESYFSLASLYQPQDLILKFQNLLPEYLTLAEAISIQKKEDYTAFLGLILASYNSFNLDRVFAEICMADNLPDHIKDIKVENIKVVGRQIKELQYNVNDF